MRRFTNSIVGLLFSVASPALAVPVQWAVSEGGNGHFYEFVEGYQLWNDASASAQAMTYLNTAGHLATVTSQEESDFLLSHFGDNGQPPLGWLGGFQDINSPDYSEPAGGWRWVTGEAWSYTNWWEAQDFPDEFQNAGQNYVRTQPDLFWDDIEEDAGGFSVRGFYVEYSGTFSLAGDLDADGYVGISDLDILLSNWGNQVTPFDAMHGDFDGDGEVDSTDLETVLLHWGNGNSSGTTIPEPNTFVCIAALLLGFASRRCRTDL